MNGFDDSAPTVRNEMQSVSTVFIDNTAACYDILRRIIRMLGFSLCENAAGADLIIGNAGCLPGKPMLTAADHFSVRGPAGTFDASALRRIDEYQRCSFSMDWRNLRASVPLGAHEKTGILSQFARVLFRVALNSGHDVRFSWFYPDGAPGVLSYRIDVDDGAEGSVEFVLRQLGADARWCSFFFTTSSYMRSPALLLRVLESGAEIGSHAHYHFTYERDFRSNRKNVGRSVGFLRSLGIPTEGYVTPSAKSYRGLGRVLQDLSLSYTSNFGMLYNALPFEFVDGGLVYLEVPVHPVAPGNFLKGAPSPDAQLAAAIVSYYMHAAERLARARLPIFFYGHNADNRKLAMLWTLLQRLKERFPAYHCLSLGEYAVFWRKRLEALGQHGWPVRENIAVITAASPDLVTVHGPREGKRTFGVEWSSFLDGSMPLSCVPPVRGLERILTTHEFEMVVPPSALDMTTLAGVKKVAFKLAQTVRHYWRGATEDGRP